MVVRGVFKGGVIQLHDPVTWSEGQELTLAVQPVESELAGNPQAIVAGLRQPPHLTREDVDVLLRSIAEGRLPVRESGVFDEGE